MKKAVIVGMAWMLSSPLWAETPPTPSAGAVTPPPAPSAPATSPADAAWEKVKVDFKGLQELGKETAHEHPEIFTSLLKETRDFSTQYPSDPRALNAQMLWAQLGDLMNQLKIPGAPTDAEISAQFDKVATDQKVPKPKRAEVRLMQLARAMQSAAQATGDTTAQWNAIENKFTDFQKEFGADFSMDGHTPVVAVLRNQELSMLASQPDKTRFNILIAKLVKDPQPEIAQMAQQMADQQKKMSELQTKPLDIKFTSVDGKEVDLSKMRGKVILVDFWATWCGPCVEEVPNVVAAYKKYHDKGFEIVGISLDQNKSKLQAFVQEHGMVWPQYFDGQGWQNKISTGFGIDSIPAMWLVDKKGMLVTTDGREDLTGQIEKLLAAP